MVQLNFAIVGKGVVGAVDVDENALIPTVKDAIARKLQFTFPSAYLDLFTTKHGAPGQDQWLSSSSAELRALQTMPTPATTKNKYLIDVSKLDPFGSVKQYFSHVPQGEVIHVLVLIPDHILEPQSRKRPPESLDEVSPPMTRLRVCSVQQFDSTLDWTERCRKTFLPADALPAVSALAAFVEEELPEKIPLTSAALASLRKSANRQLLAKLFVEDDVSPCTQYYEDVVLPNLRPTDVGGHSEASFISYWDSLIARPLLFMACGLTFDRGTSTALKCPDFVCTLNRVCVFRGEEADGATDISEPQDELKSELMWSFGSAPYILAYATSGKDCILYALAANTDGKTVVSVPLASFKTKDNPGNRLRLLLAILQLVRLFEGIVARCPATARDEFRCTVRPNGVIVELNATSVGKRFPQDGRWFHIRYHLRQVYQVIERHNVPSTDQLVETKKSTLTFVFTPRGTAMHPKTLDELFTAIGQVLECLVALHEAGWMHRDLRWDNVMKRRDIPNQWFVIDFVDAAPSPKLNDLEREILNRKNHAPEIFVDGGRHTTAVDIWGVGLLIDKCELAGEFNSADARDKFSSRLLAKDPAQRPSASEALAELRSLQTASRG